MITRKLTSSLYLAFSIALIAWAPSSWALEPGEGPSGVNEVLIGECSGEPTSNTFQPILGSFELSRSQAQMAQQDNAGVDDDDDGQCYTMQYLGYCEVKVWYENCPWIFTWEQQLVQTIGEKTSCDVDEIIEWCDAMDKAYSHWEDAANGQDGFRNCFAGCIF